MGPSVDTTDPSHFELKVNFGGSLLLGSGTRSETRYDRTKLMYYWMTLPASSLKERFLHFQEASFGASTSNDTCRPIISCLLYMYYELCDPCILYDCREWTVDSKGSVNLTVLEK